MLKKFTAMDIHTDANGLQSDPCLSVLNFLLASLFGMDEHVLHELFDH